MSVELSTLNGPGTVVARDRAPDRAPDRPTLLDFLPAELAPILRELGEPDYRARQLFGALHRRLVDRWEALTDLPRPLREELARRFRLAAGELVAEAVSTDGTRKRLLRLWDGQDIETVAIPSTSPRDRRRLSVCVSTQAGCALACTFCATGTMGLARNLSAGEIVEQVYGFARGRPPDLRPTHVVLMGMGEPLHNYQASVKAIRLLSHPDGLPISQRRITLSTSGLVPQIRRLAEEGLDVTLAISLHAPNDELRSNMMPINRRYPLRELIAATTAYAERTGRRVSYEYVLLRGENDLPEHAKQLIGLLPRWLSHVNLIPYNPTDAAYRATAPAEARRFLEQLTTAGVSATIRASRGRDITAACGQLKVENARRKARDDGPQRSSESSSESG